MYFYFLRLFMELIKEGSARCGEASQGFSCKSSNINYRRNRVREVKASDGRRSTYARLGNVNEGLIKNCFFVAQRHT